MDLSDDIQQLIIHARPFIYAWRSNNLDELNKKKEACLALAKTINEARNILYIRAGLSYQRYKLSPAYTQLRNCFSQTWEYLPRTPDLHRDFEKNNYDHPTAELNRSYDSIQDLVHKIERWI